jgi:hypothetical protein
VARTLYGAVKTKEYIESLNLPRNASTHFWELERRVKSDKNSPGVLLELKKANAIYNMVEFVRYGIITPDDLSGFSDELIENVKRILENQNKEFLQ